MKKAGTDSGPRSTTIDVRVRYVECDPQGVVHHSVYPVWMEMARTELLREGGRAYRDLEAEGVWFVVSRMELTYRKPARYDDELRVVVTNLRSGGSIIEHGYEIYRGEELLTEARTVLVCVTPEGRPRRLPEGLDF